MNIYTKKLLLSVSLILLCSVVCCSGDRDADFQSALRMASDESRGISLYNAESAADYFVGKHSGASAVGFAKAKINDPKSRKLALLILAKMAAVNEAGESSFYEAINAKNQDAMTAVAYLDPVNGRRIAETLLDKSKPSRGIKGVRYLFLSLYSYHFSPSLGAFAGFNIFRVNLC